MSKYLRLIALILIVVFAICIVACGGKGGSDTTDDSGINDPSDKPDDPSDKPDDPSDKPDDPSDKPDDPSDKPDDPSDKPDDPSDKPDDPSDKPDDPSDKPDDPSDKPDDPSDKPDDNGKFTVSFDNVGGADMPEIKVDANGKIEKPQDPERPGYSFDGWYNGAEEWDFENDTVSANTQLKAEWTVVTYNITINLGNGSIDGSIPADFTVESGDISIPNPTRPGYEFSGWNYEGAQDPVKDMVISAGSVGDKEFTAVWVIVKFNITINLEDGSMDGSVPSDFTVESSDISIPNPTKSGYEFAGWTYDGAEAPEKDLVIAAGSVGDKEYTAVWIIIEFNITVNLGNGSLDAIIPDSFTVESGNISIPNPTKNGYDFAGWTYDGQTNPEKDVVIAAGSVGDKEFTAVWNVVTFNITIDLDFGGIDVIEQGTFTVESDSITVNYAPPSRDGYTFVGWESNGVVSSEIVIPAGSVGDKSFIAVWKPVGFKINYELNGGVNNDLNPEEYDVQSSFEFLAPTREHYDFAGWYSDKALTTECKGIAPGGSGEITVWAKWTAHEYKITYELGGGVNNEYNPSTYTIESGDIYFNSPTKDYHYFTQFTKDGESYNYIPRGSYGDITLTAEWSPYEYYIYYYTNGSGGSYETVSFKGNEIPELKVPEKDGYVFAGWYKDSSLNDRVENLTDVMNKGYGNYIYLYSEWQTVTYYINYELYGGEFPSTPATSFTVEDLPLYIPTPTKTGVYFASWYKDSSLTEEVGIKITSVGNVTLHARYTALTEGIGYQINDKGDGYIVVSYEGSDDKVFIPATYENLPVKEISAGAFQNQSQITVIVVPDSVEKIGAGAFTGCSSLESITLPFIGESKKTVNDTYQYPLGYIFGTSSYTGGVSTNQSYYGSRVGSFTSAYYYIPSSLRAVTVTGGDITSGAFYGCKNITSVTVGEGVENIGYRAFYDCRALVGCYLPSTLKTIGEAAFAVCNKLTSISLPEGLTSIGKSAFESCSSLKEIVIPSTVTTMGEYVFTSCSVLEKVVLSESLSSLERGLFQNCTKLTGIEIPASVRSIKKEAFSNSGITELYVPTSVESIEQSAFYYMQKLEKLTVPFLGTSAADASKAYLVYFFGATSYSSSSNAPTSLKEVTVLGGQVGYGAFYGLARLESITLPEDMTELLSNTFYGCTSIETVKIPAGVTFIDSEVFLGCTSLSEITLPEGLTEIGYRAFSGCSALEKIVIPAACKKLGSDCFISCDKLFIICEGDGSDLVNQPYYWNPYERPIAWNASGEILTTDDGIVYVKDKDGNVTVVTYVGESDKLVIPETIDGAKVTALADYAFSCNTALKSVSVPTSVVRMGVTPFFNCTALESLTVPFIGESIEKLNSPDNYIMYLSSIVSPVPSTLKEITVTGDAKLSSSVFNGCSYIERIVITGNITEIPDRCFYYCSSLKEVALPDSVTSIGKDAFCGCHALESITIPASLKEVSDRAFVDMNSLTNVYVKSMDAWFGIKFESYTANPMCNADNFYVNGEPLVSAVVPDGITAINYHFYGITTLETVELPATLTEISEYAFSRCSSLKSVILPDGVESIGQNAFEYCTSLETIYLGNKITVIPHSAFYYSGLVEITIPDSVETIEGMAFAYCQNLKTVTFGKGLKTVGYSVFTLTTAIEVVNVDLASYLAIDFADTDSNPLSYYNSVAKLYVNGAPLTDLVVPAGVAKIGSYVLAGYDALNSVVIGNDVAEIGKYAFYECKNLKSVTIGGNVKTIGEYAFYQCSAVTTLNINNGVETIGRYAFECLSSLKAIVIPDSVTTIGDYAFAYAISARTLSIGSGLAEIPQYCFQNCGFYEVVIPDTVKTVSYYAFNSCPSLSKVTLGTGLESIGSAAFSGCGKLIEVYNRSSLTVTAKATTHGYVAFYAYTVYTTEGGSTLVTDTNGYITYNDGTDVILVGYKRGTENIVVPSNVTYLPYELFSGDTDIRSVVIPASVKTIEGRLLYGCVNIESLTIPYFGNGNGKYQFLGYIFGFTTSNSSSVHHDSVVPSSLKTVKVTDVTEIPAGAFRYCKYIENIVLPSGITAIPNDMCSECTSLRTIVIPEGVTTIGDSAFYSCRNLLSINLPASLTEIGSGAFRYCLKLSIVYNNSALELYAGDSSYGYVAAYAKYIIGPADTKPNITTDENGFVIQTEGEDKILIDYVGNADTIVIPDGVTIIGTYAIFNKNATSVIVPESVKEIRQYAFYGLTYLKTITLPFVGQYSDGSGNKQIGYIFGNSSTDTSNYTPTSLKTVIITGNTDIGEAAFSYCKRIQHIVIEGNIKNIGVNAFRELTTLQTVTVNGTVEVIDAYAFYKCTALERIDLPVGLKTIGSEAFYGCTALSGVTLPEGLSQVDYQAFYDCRSIEKIEIPTSLTKLSSGMFGSCYALKEIKLHSGITEIPSSFAIGTAITEIEIPEGVIKIGNGAFNGTKLSRVIIPDSVTTIDAGAFVRCYSLASVTLGKNVTTIGNDAFWECYGLAEIYNLSSLTLTAGSTEYGRIAEYALVIHTDINEESIVEITDDGYVIATYGDRVILVGYRGESTDIVVPDGVTEIASYLFSSNYNITSLHIPASVEIINERAFYYTNKLTKVTGCEGLKTVGKYAFYCSAITEFPLCDGLEEIGEYAFYNTKLTSVELPDTVTTMGASAFSSITTLVSVKIGKGISVLSNYAFSSCTALTKVDLGEIVELGDYVFTGCTSLRELVFPKTLRKVGKYALNCKNLTSLIIEEPCNWFASTMGHNYSGDTVYMSSSTASENAYYFRSSYVHCYMRR